METGLSKLTLNRTLFVETNVTVYLRSIVYRLSSLYPLIYKTQFQLERDDSGMAELEAWAAAHWIGVFFSYRTLGFPAEPKPGFSQSGEASFTPASHTSFIFSAYFQSIRSFYTRFSLLPAVFQTFNSVFRLFVLFPLVSTR